jgi:hypothetical protein
MSTSCRNAWLAALSLVVSVAVWEGEMRAEAERTGAIEPCAPPTEQRAAITTNDGAPEVDQAAPIATKDDAPSSSSPAVQPAPIAVPVARDPEESEPCPPPRRAAPHLVRRDYSWRWCSPP